MGANSSNINRNCFVDKDFVENDADFAVCGDGIIHQGVEECDCGVDFTLCDDPCCYPAHISPWDVWMNKSAVPCRRNAKIACVDPFRSIINYCLIAPWIFIGSSSVMIAIWLLILRKTGRCRPEFGRPHPACNEKQRKSSLAEPCLRETPFVTVKPVKPAPTIKIKPTFDTNRPYPSPPMPVQPPYDLSRRFQSPPIQQWQSRR